jgi:hypothetical protein
MIPSLTSNNSANVGLADSKYGRDFLLRNAVFKIELSDFSYIFGREFGISRFSNCDAPSALGKHVSHVIAMRSNKQMLWIYAGRIVAFMAHTHSSRNFAFMHNPRRMACVRDLSTEPKRAIPAGVYCTSPKPAGFRLVDLFTKLFLFGFEALKINLARINGLVNAFGRFVHSNCMFGFRAVSGAEYTGDGLFNLHRSRSGSTHF